MENCSIIQLSRGVANDNLPHLGCLEFVVKSGSFKLNLLLPMTATINFDNSEDAIYANGSVITSGWLCGSGIANMTATLTKTTKFIITDSLYDATSIQQLPDNTCEMEFGKSLQSALYYGNITYVEFHKLLNPGVIDLQKIGNIANFNRFIFENLINAVSGNISAFSTAHDCREISAYDNSAMTGSIASLGRLKKIEKLMISRSQSVNGSVEAFIETQCAAQTDTPARISGTLYLALSGTSCTLNSQRISKSILIVTFNSTGAVIKDNLSNTLATYDGNSWSYPS